MGYPPFRHAARRQRDMQASQASTLRQCDTRSRVRKPKKNSLHDVLRRNAGASLFVRPICWTDFHAQVLGAKFIELPSCDTPQPIMVAGSPPSRGHLRPSPTITTLSDSLTEILLPVSEHPILNANAVRTVLATLWPEALAKPQFLPELHLFFGDKVYRDVVRCQIMWTYPMEDPKSSYSSFNTVSTRPANSFRDSPCGSPGSPQGGAPMMCYIGKAQLASIRKNLFRVAQGPGKTFNEPVWRLQQLRSKLLVPANSNHDAHFVGIFLVMAQRHFYNAAPPSARRDSRWHMGEGKPKRPDFQDIKLRILTHDTETAEFLIYTGHVTAAFLDKFHDPYRIPAGDAGKDLGMRIEYTRVPIWPILGLRERLGKALGHDIVGPFDPTIIERWVNEEDDEDEMETTPNGEKRKREALSEVLNGSFGEDSDDEPTMGGKRRCLNEGPLLGLVA